MSVYPVLVYTLRMYALVVSLKIFLLVFSTTSTNGLHSSVIESMRLRRC
jgi:hypothetical protein